MRRRTPEILAKVARIKAIADRHGISMKAAGLQFALANPAVAAVIPGASRPGRIAEDRAALEEAHTRRLLARAARGGSRQSGGSAAHRRLSRLDAAVAHGRGASAGRDCAPQANPRTKEMNMTD